MLQYLDDQGHVHRKNWSRQCAEDQGLLGPKQDTNSLGQPNVKRNIFGQPEQARGFFGQQIESSDGRPLYQSASGGGEATLLGIVLLLAVGVFILALWLLAEIGKLLAAVIAAAFEDWRGLVDRYPHQMLAVHLLIGVSATFGAITAGGFALPIRVAGAALVPAALGWQWLTRRLPLVFMPINAVATGAGLLWTSQYTSIYLSLTWANLTY